MFRGSSHCSTSLPSHRRIFTMSIQDLPQRDLHQGIITYTSSTLLLSRIQSPLHRGIGTKPNHNHLYIGGIRHKAKTRSQSPLHKRDWHKVKVQPQSPLHKKDRHKAKQGRDYNLGDHNGPQTTLGDHNRPQTISLTKIRSYR